MQKYPPNVVLENVECPNDCGVGDQLVLLSRDRMHGVPGEFQIVRCSSCGLERTNPRPTPETIGEYYPEDYAPYQSNSAFSSEKKQFKLKSLLRGILGFEVRQIPSLTPGRMLEVGCASGFYMEQMRRMGWEVDGIEFSESVASVARAKGFKVQTSSLEVADSPSKPYDVITAWMVLEHLHEPVQCLRNMLSWVKPNGYLVALVPDAESLAKTMFKERCYDLQLPTHLFHFTPQTLELTLNSAGWKLDRVVWQKNCNTLLWSAEYWAKEMQHPNILKVLQWLRVASMAGKIRLLLGWLLGVTHQSGRIEVWARPINKESIPL